MAIAGGNIKLDATEGMDMITQTEKVTSPYFSNGSATLAAANIVSSSLTTTNETYFEGISHNSTPTIEEFNVAFGSVNGYGASTGSATGKSSPSEVIYKQTAGLLLGPTEVTGGFKISQGGSAGLVSGRDEEIYVLTARRSNMKDRLNKGTWTINLTGSLSNGTSGATLLELTDDSKNQNATATTAGDRYNIVSGSGGTVVKEASEKTYGHFYPDMGMLVFSATELSASIPGRAVSKDDVVMFDSGSHFGFGTGTQANENKKNGLRFVNCLQPNGASMTFRDEEDQLSAQYFCRIRSGHMNFSNNPTFVSGSMNELRNKKMKGNPNTFITSVQLYNSSGDMVAVGSLSKPLKKNFSSENTINVKLTY